MADTIPVPAEAGAQVPVPNSPTPPPSPEPKADAPQPADASAMSEQPKAPTEPEAPQTPEQKQDEKPKSRVQERIDQLTAQRRTAEARAQFAERRLAELMQPIHPPDPHDFDAQNAHQIRSAIRQEKAQDLHQEMQVAAQEAFTARRSTYEAKLDDAAERIPDIASIRDTFYRSVAISEPAADVLASSDKAAEITAFLVRNPAEAQRISSLHPQWQAVEIARLEARVAPAPQVRRVSQAPAPPPTIGGGSPSSAKSPADMSVAEMQAFLYGNRRN